MAVVVGYQGLPVSWASPNDTMFALHTFNEMSIEVSAQELDTTRFRAAGSSPLPGVYEGLNGLRSWRGVMRGMNATPVPGHIGLVSLTGSPTPYFANAHSWSLNLSCTAELDVTAFQPSADWAAYVCGVVSWGGDYACWFDDTTAMTMPNLYNATVTPTFTISGTSTITGSANITGVSVGASVNGRTLVRFTYRGTAAPTFAGAGNIVGAAATFSPFTASSLVMKWFDGGTDRTMTGTAFPTNIGVNCVTGDKTTTEVAFRGSGQLSVGT